jgi:hypothetical protein
MFEFKYAGWSTDYPDEIAREEWLILHEGELVGLLCTSDRVLTQSRSNNPIVIKNRKQLIKDFYEYMLQ